MLEAVLAYTREHLDEFSPDDLETIIARIDALSEIATVMIEHAGDEQREKLAESIDKLGQMRSRLESK